MFAFLDSSIPTIVFNANRVTSFSASNGQIMVFRSVISNIGNGYNSTTGKFTAPVNGTYSFTVHMCVHWDKTAYFHLVVDGQVVTNLSAFSNHWTTTSSSTVQVFLTQGQEVWVQSADSCSSCLLVYSVCWNQFSGSLIHI